MGPNSAEGEEHDGGMDPIAKRKTENRRFQSVKTGPRSLSL